MKCLKRPPLKRRRGDPAVRSQCGIEAGLSGRDVAAEMAAMLEMSCAYIPEFGVTNSRAEVIGYMGNAILSAAPFDDVARSRDAPTAHAADVEAPTGAGREKARRRDS